MSILSRYRARLNECKEKIVCIFQEMLEVKEANIDWGIKFDLIFETHDGTLWPLLNQLTDKFTYISYGKNTTYQDDVETYLKALEEFIYTF